MHRLRAFISTRSDKTLIINYMFIRITNDALILAARCFAQQALKFVPRVSKKLAEEILYLAKLL